MSFDRPDFEEFVRDFSPGFIDVPEENGLPNGATPDARNSLLVAVSVLGEGSRARLAKRPGCRLLNPTAMIDYAKGDGLFEFRQSNGTRQLIAVVDGRAWVFDDVDTFLALAGGGMLWTPGRTARAEFSKDNAFIHDGSAQYRWNGTTMFVVGQIAPTGVQLGIGSSPGVTGTYEAVYTWYDPVMDHESSPSPISNQVVVTNQARLHYHPQGTPAAQYTQWRAYVRRVDTSETKFGRVGTWPYGAPATQTEAVIDTARVNFSPAPGDNDPPPGPWAILKEWKGYFFGVRDASSDYNVSKLGDAQSWPPRFVFSVRKGDGESITGVKNFGREILIQKPHRTWRLVGDTPPFSLEPMHSSFGGVSQESGGEVDSLFYDWDRIRGPYKTDGVTWTSLVDGRIKKFIETVNVTSLADIRFIHAEGKGLVGWAFATGGSPRKRTLLWYNYLLDAWLPPWTGLEYGSLANYTNSVGQVGTYVADYWGRVFELFSGTRDGAPSQTSAAALVQPVVAATPTTVTVGAVPLPTAGSGLAGLSVAVLSPAGTWQWRRIRSNTATTITIDTVTGKTSVSALDAPWNTVPDAFGWIVVIAGIEWYHWTPWYDRRREIHAKQLHWLYLEGRTTSKHHLVEIRARFNDRLDITRAADADVSSGEGQPTGIWGEAIWGAAIWSQTTSKRCVKHRIEQTALSVQFALSNFYPDQPVVVSMFGMDGDQVATRKVASI